MNSKTLFIKNIRNNLLSCKRFIFQSFTFHKFRDIIDPQSSEIFWKIFYNLFKKNETSDANLKKAPKVTTKVNFAKPFS